MQYELLKQLSARHLSEEVTNYLKEGWELYKEPFYADSYYHQAVIKKEKL